MELTKQDQAKVRNLININGCKPKIARALVLRRKARANSKAQYSGSVAKAQSFIVTY